MSATTTQARRPIDWSKPISKQFGGRFLTPTEADAGFDREVVEYVEMNLRAISEAMFGVEGLEAPSMTFEQLGVLLNYANHTEWEADQLREWARSIRANTISIFQDDDALAALKEGGAS